MLPPSDRFATRGYLVVRRRGERVWVYEVSGLIQEQAWRFDCGVAVAGRSLSDVLERSERYVAERAC